MSITRRVEIETDYTDGSSNGGNTGGNPGSGDDGKGIMVRHRILLHN